MYKAADLNNDGTIQFAEFVVAAMKQEELHSEKKLQDAFNAFDKDKNGSIDKQELMTIFEFSEGFDIAEIESMIKEVDQNGDGQIQFEEFKQMMLGGKMGSKKSINEWGPNKWAQTNWLINAVNVDILVKI